MLTFALPNSENIPPLGDELPLYLDIPLHVPRQLLIPVVGTRLRAAGMSAAPLIMLMPEAPMHEDNLTPPSENNIRPARKCLHM